MDEPVRVRRPKSYVATIHRSPLSSPPAAPRCAKRPSSRVAPLPTASTRGRKKLVLAWCSHRRPCRHESCAGEEALGRAQPCSRRRPPRQIAGSSNPSDLPKRVSRTESGLGVWGQAMNVSPFSVSRTPAHSTPNHAPLDRHSAPIAARCSRKSIGVMAGTDEPTKSGTFRVTMKSLPVISAVTATTASSKSLKGNWRAR